MKLYQHSDYLAQAETLADPKIDLNQIKGASLNLKIGKIYVPGTSSEELGGVAKPLTVFSLQQGATVVLKTSQEIKLNARQTGIMFPPNHVSLKGVLMTNPGHVDPGFEGHLHVTVINMGSAPYPLKLDEQVIRLMIFELDDKVENPYGVGKDPVTEELLKNLSFDFFDINKRIKSEIEVQERKTKMWAIGVPVIASILTLAVAIFFNISQFGERIARIEGSASASAITKQLDQTRFELLQVSNKLDQLEKRSSTAKTEKQ